jgi:hypothetical protein
MKRLNSIFHAVLCCLVLIELLCPVTALGQFADLSATDDVIYYAPKAKVLGGQFALQTLLPVANGSLASLEARSKLAGSNHADTWAQSLTLQWDWGRANSWVGYTFTAPTGRDAPRTTGNIFSQYWSNSITSGTAAYFGRNNATAATLTTDWEVLGQAQRVKGTTGTLGESFTMEWGVTRIIPLNYQMTRLLEVGTAGYDEWLRANGVALLPEGLPADGTPFSVHAIGFQTTFILPAKNLSFSFKYEPAYLRSANAPGRIIVIGCSWTW